MDSRLSLTIDVLAATVAIAVLLLGTRATMREHRQRFEERDLGVLAALTRLDHSTIFFHGYTRSGYVRDGVVHNITLREPVGRTDLDCRGRAVSRDGARIAYVVPDEVSRRCVILVRNVVTSVETPLVEVSDSQGPLAWSWDDREIVYERTHERSLGLFAVSTTDGRERLLAGLPIRSDANVPISSWELKRVDWLHNRSGLIISVDVCIPDREPGSCHGSGQVLRLSAGGDGHLLAVGWGASVSPANDRVGFVSSSTIEAIDADGSNRRRVVSVPFGCWFLPFFGREETGWSSVVWSPAGDRLIFNTVLDEEFNSNYYLVDAGRRTRRPLLKDMSIDILDWR